MEITKREVIASIVIIALMLILGFTISEKIANSQNDKNSEYQKAIHIDGPELFQYGMDTSVGNAFVYGSLEAVEPVSFEEVEGEYIWIKKTEEHYNRHTRKVKKPVKNQMVKQKPILIRKSIILGTITTAGRRNVLKSNFAGLNLTSEKYHYRQPHTSTLKAKGYLIFVMFIVV